MDDAEEPPPDPMPSLECHCLLQDLDWHKLILLLNGHPAARGTALLLQAIRQQMSVASVQDYAKNALDWIIENDVLTLKMKKNSVVRRVLQAEGVDSREQMARLINTMASYPRGRQYFTTHLKSFLPCVVAILRGKRLPSTTHDQLIACIQKMSVRQSAQKELLQCGMLEWAIAHFEQKLNNYALEYLSALFINLSTNHLSHPMIMRYADSIAAAVISVLNRGSHGAACSINNTFVLASLNCSRVRLRARETRLYEALKYRTEGRRSCPLCNLHVPYLLAVITNGRIREKLKKASFIFLGLKRGIFSSRAKRPTLIFKQIVDPSAKPFRKAFEEKKKEKASATFFLPSDALGAGHSTDAGARAGVGRRRRGDAGARHPRLERKSAALWEAADTGRRRRVLACDSREAGDSTPLGAGPPLQDHLHFFPFLHAKWTVDEFWEGKLNDVASEGGDGWRHRDGGHGLTSAALGVVVLVFPTPEASFSMFLSAFCVSRLMDRVSISRVNLTWVRCLKQ
ncbi:unnamed protein product [Caenorhabditis auriculariae]|uniref:LisH domain-containing protein n=1 Tax=Caenorhabditis auriculariae TaxID=2777116 RepID=A0A8S1HKZ9_9PELO|nr:unnamed protein product [Caenorhabditis auriculariae]